MTDRADLIRRLNEAVSAHDARARIFAGPQSRLHANTAALLREAVRALETEEATRNQHNVIYGPAGKAP